MLTHLRNLTSIGTLPEIFSDSDKVSDKNYFFESGKKKNLKLCAVAGSIPICSGVGYQAATILRQPTTCIHITDDGLIVNLAFLSEWLKIRDFGHRIPVCPSVVF